MKPATDEQIEVLEAWARGWVERNEPTPETVIALIASLNAENKQLNDALEELVSSAVSMGVEK